MLLTILQAVNPGIGKDKSGLLRRSVTVCRRMQGGDSAAQIAAVTKQEFTNGSYVPSPAEAKAVDSAITSTFCR